MDIVPTPSEDQVPRLQAFRAEHPDIEIASPADSRTGMWPAYQGGKILVRKWDLSWAGGSAGGAERRRLCWGGRVSWLW